MCALVIAHFHVAAHLLPLSKAAPFDAKAFPIRAHFLGRSETIQLAPCPARLPVDRSAAQTRFTRNRFLVIRHAADGALRGRLKGGSLESPLPDVAAVPVVAQVSAYVRGEKPVHPAAQVAVSPGPEYQMEMVVHQAVGHNLHWALFLCYWSRNEAGSGLLTVFQNRNDSSMLAYL